MDEITYEIYINTNEMNTIDEILDNGEMIKKDDLVSSLLITYQIILLIMIYLYTI